MATIKLVNGKWHCYSPVGISYCAFDRKDWAVECAKANGWEPIAA